MRACLPSVTAIVLAVVAGANRSSGASAADAAPASLSVAPAAVELIGPRAKQQLLVTASFLDRLESDHTCDAVFESLDPRIVRVTGSGLLSAQGDGQTAVVVRAAGLEASVQVVVREFAQSDPIDFRTEVVAALGRGGCNQGACHGSPQGKNGFRLSLRGYAPDIDFTTLTREAFARRTNRAEPAQSLILQKATARVPHQGGRRFQEDETACRLLHQWVVEGCVDSVRPRTVVSLEVMPQRRYLHTSSPRQQLVLRAHFNDGSVRDVTDLAVFSSSNDDAAKVTREGQVEFHQTAEVAILARYLNTITSARLTYVRRDPNFTFAAPVEVNYVDRYVFAKQQELQLKPAPVASDEVFLRRVYLDVINTPPTGEETRAFLDSTDSEKRVKLIDELLERPDFANSWALKWADIMRGNREAVTERGVHSLHRYLVQVFAEDRAFVEFAREILTSVGNTLHTPPANFFRISPTPDEAAESASQLFLGVRIQCAKCHNHPFEAITQDDYYGLAAYFARVRLKGQRFGLDDEIVYLDSSGDVRHPVTGQVVAPTAFGVPAGEVSPDQDRRQRLVEWLTAPSNPYFARSIVNRIWYQLFGRGIVEPVDDFRETNPPTNAELLDALARDFVAGQYRVKPILRTILNSSTYQLRAEPTETPTSYGADPDLYFTHALVRMLTAEQTVDAISSATGIPEVFKGYPAGTRAIELAEGAVEDNFLKAFSKPIRDVACDCAREADPSLNQVLHLINNPNLLAKIESPASRLSQWLREGKETVEIVQLMYLATVSRRPTPPELHVVLQHVANTDGRVEGLRDLQHALINSHEFLLRH